MAPRDGSLGPGSPPDGQWPSAIDPLAYIPANTRSSTMLSVIIRPPKTPEKHDPPRHVGGVGALIASSFSPHTVEWIKVHDQIDKDRLLLWAEAACGLYPWFHSETKWQTYLSSLSVFLQKTQRIKEICSLRQLRLDRCARGVDMDRLLRCILCPLFICVESRRAISLCLISYENHFSIKDSYHKICRYYIASG